MLSEVKKKDVRVQNSTLILGERGWGRQGKGLSISTMRKGAILRKCVNIFVPHCSYSCSTRDNASACSDYFKNSAASATSEDKEVRYSINKSRAEFSLKLTIKNRL